MNTLSNECDMVFMNKKNIVNAYREVFMHSYYLDSNTAKAQDIRRLLEINNITDKCRGFILDGVKCIDKKVPVVLTDYSNLDDLLKRGYCNLYFLEDSFEIRKINNYEKKFYTVWNLDKSKDSEFSRNILVMSAINILKQLKAFVQSRGGEFILLCHPALKDVKNHSDYERRCLDEGSSFSDEERNEILRSHGQEDFLNTRHLFPIVKDGQFCNESKISKEISTKNNFRVTTNQPEKYLNTIYLLGSSTTYGYGLKDEDTLASNLQRIINDFSQMHSHRMHVPYFCVQSRATGFDLLLKHLSITEHLDIKNGDLIILCTQDSFFNLAGSQNHLQEPSLGMCTLNDAFSEQSIASLDNFANLCSHAGISVINGSRIFDRPHSYGEVFFDHMHLTKNGNEALAKFLFDGIKNRILEKIYQKELDDISNQFIEDHLQFEKSYDLENSPLNLEYIKYIRKYKLEHSPDLISENIGAIVMNCNPFTLGHKHLISYAASRCDILYIFVVEENLSTFSFNDRIALVKRGVQDIGGGSIEVLPSGTLISRKSFPGYWGLYDFISPEIDIENFAKHIAPILGIKKRFAGKEPFSETTEKYNRFMENILPKYGIEFIEIDRIAIDGDTVSASKVRNALENNDMDEVKKLVPATTYDFILRNREKPVLCVNRIFHKIKMLLKRYSSFRR